MRRNVDAMVGRLGSRLLSTTSIAFALAGSTACGSSQKASTTTVTIEGIGEPNDSTTSPTTADRTTTSTIAASTSGATTTSVAETPIGPLSLTGSGIGFQTFGEPADQVVAAIESELGTPIDDREEEAFSSSYGVCPGNRIRVVEWGGFVVLFSDGATPYSPGGSFTFFDWQLRNLGAATPPLETPAGIGLGDSAATVRAAYPSARIEADEILGPVFRVGAAPDELRGNLTSTNDDGTITGLAAGSACGE
jgi:hypothetical protein